MKKFFKSLTSSKSSHRDERVLCLGLDQAGKTQLLYFLKLGDMVTTIPTIGFNVETISFFDVEFTIWDVGGQDQIRPLWRHYIDQTASLVFCVDAAEPGRFEDARAELAKTLGYFTAKQRAGLRLVLAATKRELPGAVPLEDVVRAVAPRPLVDSDNFFPTSLSVAAGENVYEWMHWVATKITRRPKVPCS
eukprot:TRINITY_DN2258_c0_g1_i1.p1 TRINITY_DN2258_c0_g1~~TRINITY_DN2258_c0_g1_i1.p1  ORF type:complete len:191 (+),score=33.27 TRINITY_DN2258_c0_g1_i1:38-610(+)